MNTVKKIAVRILLSSALIFSFVPQGASAATATDDTAVQFGAGTTSGTDILTREDGEVRLGTNTVGSYDGDIGGGIEATALGFSDGNVARSAMDKFGNIYVVFTATVSGKARVHFIGSRDGGLTWDGDLADGDIDAATPLPQNSNGNPSSFLPDITVDDSVSPPRAYVAFLDDITAGGTAPYVDADADVYVTSMTPGTSGATWTGIRKVNTLGNFGGGAANRIGTIRGGPRIELSPTSNDMYVVWNNDTAALNQYHVYFSKADRASSTGEFIFDADRTALPNCTTATSPCPELRIDDNTASGSNLLSASPVIAVASNNTVYVAYTDGRFATSPIVNQDRSMFVVSFTPNDGLASPPAASVRVDTADGNPDAKPSLDPNIALDATTSGSNQKIFIVYSQKDTTSYRTNVAVSTNNGGSFTISALACMSSCSGDILWPDIAVDPFGNAAVVHSEISPGDVAYNYLPAGSTSWQTNNVALPSASPVSDSPSIAVNDAGDFLAVWRDTRSGTRWFGAISLDSGVTWNKRFDSSGTFTSRPIDLGDASVNPGIFLADRFLPGGGVGGGGAMTLKFQWRAAASLGDVASQPFTGPDGTGGSYYTGLSVASRIVNGLEQTDINLDGKRYVQYMATLGTGTGSPSGLSPYLRSVTLDFSGDGPLVRLSGSDRYGTAAVISQNQNTPASVESLVVASGEVFADALPGGPMAALLGGPLLLTRGSSLPSATGGEITRVLQNDLGDTDVYILGGVSAVSTAVENAIKGLRPDIAVKRIGGDNRVHTSKLIAEEMDAIRASKGLGSANKAFISLSTNFPDALAASGPGSSSSVNAKYMSILLTGGGALDQTIKDYLSAKSGTLSTVYLTGGTAALSNQVLLDADAIIGTAKRLSGVDRYATAAAINNEFYVGGLAPACIGVATGENFPDALAGGKHAGSKNCPIVLIKRVGVPGPTSTYVIANAGTISGGFVYGGIAPIPDGGKALMESYY